MISEKTQANPKKTQGIWLKTQCTRGKSLLHPLKKRENKKPALTSWGVCSSTWKGVRRPAKRVESSRVFQVSGVRFGIAKHRVATHKQGVEMLQRKQLSSVEIGDEHWSIRILTLS